MNAQKRQEIEKRLVRKLVREMKAGGWDACRVWDGGENVKCGSEGDVMDAVFSVDDSGIRFVKVLADGSKIARGAAIVLGNDGYDAIADYSLSDPACPEDDFEVVMGRVSEYSDKLEMEVCR